MFFEKGVTMTQPFEVVGNGVGTNGVVFSAPAPAEGMSLAELSQCVQDAWHAILGANYIALAYWRIGKALRIAKAKFLRHEYEEFRNKLIKSGIHKSSLSLACTINFAFASESDCDGIPICEARTRASDIVKQRTGRKSPTSKPFNCAVHLARIETTVHDIADAFGAQAANDIARSLVRIRNLITFLEDLVAKYAPVASSVNQASITSVMTEVAPQPVPTCEPVVIES